MCIKKTKKNKNKKQKTKMPVMFVYKCEIMQDVVEIYSRDSRKWIFKGKEGDSNEKITKEVKALSFPLQMFNLFAFQHGFAIQKVVELKHLIHWDIFSIQSEYERMGIKTNNYW